MARTKISCLTHWNSKVFACIASVSWLKLSKSFTKLECCKRRSTKRLKRGVELVNIGSWMKLSATSQQWITGTSTRSDRSLSTSRDTPRCDCLRPRYRGRKEICLGQVMRWNRFAWSMRLISWTCWPINRLQKTHKKTRGLILAVRNQATLSTVKCRMLPAVWLKKLKRQFWRRSLIFRAPQTHYYTLVFNQQKGYQILRKWVHMAQKMNRKTIQTIDQEEVKRASEK